MEIDEVEGAVKNLNDIVVLLKEENRKLRETVDFLTEHPRPPQSAPASQEERRDYSSAGASKPQGEQASDNWQEAVRHIVRAEQQRDARQHNAILSGLPESVADDKVAEVLLKNVHELEGQVQAFHRLGRQIPTPTPGAW